MNSHYEYFPLNEFILQLSIDKFAIRNSKNFYSISLKGKNPPIVDWFDLNSWVITFLKEYFYLFVSLFVCLRERETVSAELGGGRGRRRCRLSTGQGVQEPRLITFLRHLVKC